MSGFFSILASNLVRCVLRVAASILRTSSHHMHKPRVSAFLWSNTLALGSCLCDNKSKTRQQQAVVLSQNPPRKPPRPLRLCVPFSQFLKRASARPKRQDVASPHFSKTLSVSPYLFFLPVSPKAIARASLYSFSRLTSKRQNSFFV